MRHNDVVYLQAWEILKGLYKTSLPPPAPAAEPPAPS